MYCGRIIQFFEKNMFFQTGFFRVQNGVRSCSKVDLPLPPKRPMTAFLLFCKHNRQSLFKDKSLSAPEQTKILAEKWSNLNPASKKTYEDTAREETIAYSVMHKEYFESLTEAQKDELSRLKAEKKESRRLFRLRKALRESGIPKAPKSAYALYLQSQAHEKEDFVSLSEFSKEMSSKWRSMSEEERQPYLDRARENKESYARGMKLWREKLVDSGNLDLLKAYDESKLKGKSISSEPADSKGYAIKHK